VIVERRPDSIVVDLAAVWRGVASFHAGEVRNARTRELLAAAVV
jgi:hypothetical protein